MEIAKNKTKYVQKKEQRSEWESDRKSATKEKKNTERKLRNECTGKREIYYSVVRVFISPVELNSSDEAKQGAQTTFME